MPYSIKDLHETLNEYAGKSFGDSFFNKYIYNSKMPDYKSLFSKVGLKLNQESDAGYFGASINENTLSNNTIIGSPAYNAGLEKGDEIKEVNGIKMTDENHFSDFIKTQKQGEKLKITYLRNGNKKETELVLSKDPKYTITIDKEADEKAILNRNNWLK